MVLKIEKTVSRTVDGERRTATTIPADGDIIFDGDDDDDGDGDGG